MKVRSKLYSRGFRYRLHEKIPGKPDIVFKGKKIAIFVHGCFWHLHGCRLSTLPKSNAGFWEDKLKRNKERDQENAAQLNSEGWKTIILWECKLKDNCNGTLDKVFKALK